MRFFVSIAAALLATLPLAAQTPASLDRELRVYFDCPNMHCDGDFLIQQIPWVDFVRDRAVADVHVLVTGQGTGGGGEELTLRFIGRDAFQGMEHTLVALTEAGATDDDERRALARSARLGLAPFAAATPVAASLDVAGGDVAEAASTVALEDPWDRWVFEFGVNSWFEGEARFESLELSGWAGASRVTDDWRLAFSVDGHNDSERFEVDDSTTVESRREGYGSNALVVKTISPHWSVGGYGGGSRSTRSNYDLSLRVAPAIEYSVFPYAESTSRLLTVLYAIGPRYYDYAERTLFDRMEESVLHHFVAVSYDATQPWGSIDALFDVTHIITPLDGSDGWGDPKYALSLDGGVELSVVQGLSLRFDGGAALVRNQIHLPAGGLTPEEILTQQRERATDYRYYASIGMSYQFGSIFSPVVNRRLDYLD